jgi:hypothetical protein
VKYREYIPSHRWTPRAPGEAEALKRARAIVADPERWTTGSMSRDKEGRQTGVFETRVTEDGTGPAYSYSAIGACQFEGLPVERAYALLYVQPFSPLWVERLGHAEVLAMFDRAIAAAEVHSVEAAA